MLIIDERKSQGNGIEGVLDNVFDLVRVTTAVVGKNAGTVKTRLLVDRQTTDPRCDRRNGRRPGRRYRLR